MMNDWLGWAISLDTIGGLEWKCESWIPAKPQAWPPRTSSNQSLSVPPPQDEAIINVNRLTFSMPRCIGLALRAMLG